MFFLLLALAFRPVVKPSLHARQFRLYLAREFLLLHGVFHAQFLLELLRDDQLVVDHEGVVRLLQLLGCIVNPIGARMCAHALAAEVQ